MAISYRDGAEERVGRILRASADLSSLALLAPEGSDWELVYHLAPERGNLLRPFDFDGLSVLELGAGMGGASRVVAERCARYVGVEGAPDRAVALRERLRDLPHASVEVCNLADFVTDERFDVVLLVGVLEYAALYVDSPGGDLSPFEHVLECACAWLKPGGALVVAIENRNGLKYWAGAPEDHTSRPFDGIVGYPHRNSPRTFSRRVLLQLLRSAGLGSVDEFYPWPDYKMPSVIVSGRLVQSHPFFAAELVGDAQARALFRHPENFPLSLAAMELARSGLLHEFSNSFLFVGFARGGEDLRGRLLRRLLDEGELAWHYSLKRRVPAETAFASDGSEGLVVRKRSLAPGSSEFETVRWLPRPEQPARLERSVFHHLRALAFAGRAEEFQDTLERFLDWALDRYGLPDGGISPEALDVNPTNAVPDGQGFDLFDIEWVSREPIPASWFILRTLFTIEDAVAMFPSPPWNTLAELYALLCRRYGISPDLDSDLAREARLQTDTHRHLTAESVRDALSARFKDARSGSGYQRDAAADWSLRKALSGGDAPIRMIARMLLRAVVRRVFRLFRRTRIRPSGAPPVGMAGSSLGFGILVEWLGRS